MNTRIKCVEKNKKAILKEVVVKGIGAAYVEQNEDGCAWVEFHSTDEKETMLVYFKARPDGSLEVWAEKEQDNSRARFPEET